MLSETTVRSIRDRVLLLRSFPRTAVLRDESLILMAEHAKDRFYEKGALVMDEGRPVESLHMVIDGMIHVTREGKHVSNVDRGGGVGFLSVFSRDEQGVRAEAMEPTYTIEIPVPAMLDAYEEDFALTRNTLRIISSMVVEMRGNLPRDVGSDTEVDEGTYPQREPTLVERVLRFQTGPFSRANLEAIVELARATKSVRYDPGETIWAIGDPSTFWISTECGRIRCRNEDGDEVRVGAGYVLGVMDSLSAEPRRFDAVAETVVVADHSNRETFLNVLETHHQLAMEFIALLTQMMMKLQIK
ncbi:MAG: cyclic nucleotide-binding domain-containing protein [Myxococcota bacterium]